MRFQKEAIDEMAKEKSSSKEKVQAAIISILILANRFRNDGGRFSFGDYPELDEEVNRILIALSDDLLKEAEERAIRLLEMLGEAEDEEAILEEAERGENGIVWALDMHSSNLKHVLEAWIAIMFARSLSVNETYTKVITYMDAPDASGMWRDAVRKRLVDPNEVRFGKGYQRKVADAFAILLQTLIYTSFLAGTIRKGRKGGAIGYRTFRQSGYDCALCDALTERIWPIGVMVLPAHPRCVCGVEFVYDV